MTQTILTNSLELAKQGDPQAIAQLFNQSLQPKGITVEVQSIGEGVSITLISGQTIAQKTAVALIQQAFQRLEIKSIPWVRVNGKLAGRDDSLWQEELNLSHPEVQPDPVNPSVSISQPRSLGATSPPAPARSAYRTLSPAANRERPVEQRLKMGDYLLQSTPHGIKVDVVPDSPVRLQARSMPTAAQYFPAVILLNRQYEMQTAIATLQSAAPVEFYGEAGSGKTTLLRALAYHEPLTPLFSEGLVYLRVNHQPIEDIAQRLFDQFFTYDSQLPVKPTHVELRQVLQGQQVLILLDDTHFAPAEVEALRALLPDPTFVFASEQRQLWNQGQAIELNGLPVTDALLLVEQEFRRALTPEERPIAEAVCRLLRGHPLRILQTVTLVRDQVCSWEILLQQLQIISPEELVLRVSTALPEPERRVLAVLTVIGQTWLHTQHLAALAAIADLTPVLEQLVRRNLILLDGQSYQLANNLLQPLREVWELTQWTDRILQYFVQWSQEQTPQTLLQETETARTVVELAQAVEQVSIVLSLGRILDTTLTFGKLWGAADAIAQMHLAAGRARNDTGQIAWALHELGSRALCSGDIPAATSLLTQALQLREAAGADAAAAVTRHNLGLLPDQPAATLAPVSRPSTSRQPLPRSAIKLIAGAASLGLGGLLAWGLFTLFAPPQVSLDRDRVEFTAQLLNRTSQSQAIQLQNLTSNPVEIGSIVAEGDQAAEFQITDDCTVAPLLPADDCTIEITFTPQEAGTRQATLLVRDRQGKVLARLPLTGNGQANPDTSVLNLNPSIVDFGEQVINEQAAPRQIEVTNRGDTPLTIRRVALTGRVRDDFKLGGTCVGAVLQSGGTCTIEVAFAPTEVDSRRAIVEIEDDQGRMWNVPITGKGVAERPASVSVLNVSPRSLSFEPQFVEAFSGRQTVTINNTGSNPLKIEQIHISGQHPDDFQVFNPCETAIAPGESCDIEVAHTPLGFGDRRALLEIISNARDGRATVHLTGRGLAESTPPNGSGTPTPEVAQISVTPTNVDFGIYEVGQSSPVKGMTIHNDGNVPLKVGDIQVRGDRDFFGNQDAPIGEACQNLVLAPGEVCQFGVLFNPIVAGERQAQVIIPSDADNGTVTIRLTGSGQVTGSPVLTVSPQSWDYGSQPLGSSTVQAFTLTNTGQEVLQLGAISFNGDRGFNPARKSAADTSIACSNIALNPQQSCRLEIEFYPLDAGNLTTQVAIASNSANGAVALNLKGTGTQPQYTDFSVNAQVLELSPQNPTQLVTLTSIGTAPLAITGFELLGDTANVFQIEDGCSGALLQPNQRCNLAVSFNPPISVDAYTQEYIAELRVYSDANGSPAIVRVKGLVPRSLVE